MCVFKYHAFIYFLRPPPWSGTTLLFLLPSGFGLWNRVSIVVRQNKEKAGIHAFCFCARRFRFSTLVLLRTHALCFALRSRARMCEKSAGTTSALVIIFFLIIHSVYHSISPRFRSAHYHSLSSSFLLPSFILFIMLPSNHSLSPRWPWLRHSVLHALSNSCTSAG
jgi:hypothetical protein